MNTMLGFAGQVFVSKVEADVLDVSSWEVSASVRGRTTVTLVGGPHQLEVRDWRGIPPRVGDEFTLTIEAVRVTDTPT